MNDISAALTHTTTAPTMLMIAGTHSITPSFRERLRLELLAVDGLLDLGEDSNEVQAQRVANRYHFRNRQEGFLRVIQSPAERRPWNA